ncbi:MAG TPA: PAS domain-containing sensor histidine kinase [candidate division Zixibacteria bacterium]|nr:PAS domain-containing sensor histidine kinase [candidate division Zixibacteria bacterium]
MPKRRLMWQLFASYLVVTILAISVITVYMAISMKKLYLTEVSSDLKARAILFRDQLIGKDSILFAAHVDSLCKKFGHKSATRFTVILPSGIVIGDTDDDPLKMENHSNRPEVIDALSGRSGVATRYSHTLYETMMYVAEPINQEGKVVGIVRAALPVTDIDHTFGQIYPRVIIGGLLITLILGFLSLYISRRISVPLERIKLVAGHYSKGEFDHLLPPGNTIEIDSLTNTLNQMAVELKEKIRTVEGQRNELDAVLSSMVEGVLAFDTSEHLVNLNQAAARMLSIDREQVRGRYVQEAVRNIQLQNLVSRILKSEEPQEDEMAIQGNGGRVLQMHGTILRNDKGESLGALVVLNDITRLRHLESIRRDFVANVSHELKTPITSIKGFVETLQDESLKDPRDTERFLAIISKQADRLNSIIEDLLTLSKIEESEKAEILLEEHKLRAVLQSAVSICDIKAKAKKIAISLNCDDDLCAKINAELLEQAIINLLDNAIKYSNKDSEIKISALILESEVAITIQDWGVGIEKRHLPRLFERFYTVDKARSKELGGTGLGLAIVKHIVLAHHGNVSVESAPDKGSTFTIHLPCL